MTSPSTSITFQRIDNNIILQKGDESYTLSAISIEGQNTAAAVDDFVKWISDSSEALESIFNNLSEKEVNVLKFDSNKRQVQLGTIAKGQEDHYKQLTATATASHTFAVKQFTQINACLKWNSIPPVKSHSSPSSSSTSTTHTKEPASIWGTAFMSVSSGVSKLTAGVKSLLPTTTSPSQSPPSPTAEVSQVAGPMGIKNPDIACYRIASIQGLIACPSFRHLLEQPIRTGISHEDREAIRCAFLDLVKALDDKTLQSGNPNALEGRLNKLVEAYSKKIGHYLTLVEPTNPLNKQLDANDYVEIILNEVLNQSNQYTKRASGVYREGAFEVDLAEDMRPEEPTAVLSINFKGLHNAPLTHLINQAFTLEHVVEQGQTTRVAGYELSEYDQVKKITSKPKPMLAIRMERGAFNPDTQTVSYNQTPLGISKHNFDKVDLSVAYDTQPGTHLYAITSFIKRIPGYGSYANLFGHFVSYVKQGDQWYECNDNRVTAIHEDRVKAEMAHAYMFFLEQEKHVPLQHAQSTHSAASSSSSSPSTEGKKGDGADDVD